MKSFTLAALIAFYLVLNGCSQAQQNAQQEKQQVQTTGHSTTGGHNVIPVAEFKQHLDSGEDLILVDVRTPGEYSDGHISGALLIDYTGDSFEEQSMKLDQSKPLFVYCHSGNRSGRASEILAANGYTVYDLKGGIMAWMGAGYATEK